MPQIVYPPLAALTRIHTLPVDMELPALADKDLSALGLEERLVQFRLCPESQDEAQRLVYFTAALTASFSRAFLAVPTPRVALEQHFALMIHRVIVHSVRDAGFSERTALQQISLAYRQIERMRHLLLAPARDLSTLHHLRLHLADLSNYVCFAHAAAPLSLSEESMD